MNYVIVDFEMCRLNGNAKKKMGGEKHEIIQIGAVMLDHQYQIIEEFSSYVRPEYGKVDPFIEELTGIKQENVENAPKLIAVLSKFVSWINNRNVKVMSWSDSDYFQLQKEMRIKKIKNRKIQFLLDEWVDFQRSFDKMLGMKSQIALENAMRIGNIPMLGRVHDGLCDAYNTARLLMKVQRQSAFSLEFIPICEYAEKVNHLSFHLGELFTEEILMQIEPDVETYEIETEQVEKSDWSIWRRVYSFLKRKENVTDEKWNTFLFKMEMKKLDLFDFFKREKLNDTGQSCLLHATS